MPRELPDLKNAKNLEGKRALLRSSFNVPLIDGKVANTFRLKRALSSIYFLQEAGAKIILIGHIGREKTATLEPVAKALNEFLPVKWCPDLTGELAKDEVRKLKNGELLLLENVRRESGEEENVESLARELASLGDIYINDAFSDSHRNHASICGVAKLLPTYFGLNFMNEYEELSKAMNPKSPSLFILGGAKFETKIPLVEKYAEKYDQVFIGGALANDIFKAKGFEVGDSLVSNIDLNESNLLKGDNLLLPQDVVVTSSEGNKLKKIDEVKMGERIMDAGMETIKMLEPLVKEAETILWNGPLGNYEHGFNQPTEALARLIADSKAFSVVGGGDTIAAIEVLALQEKFGFVSTAGGAMLTFLETGTLVGIDAVLDNKLV